MKESLILYENKTLINKYVTEQNRQIYLRLPKNKVVLGRHNLASPNEKYSPVEFWSMYNYLSSLIFIHKSYGNNIVILSKRQILYELGCSKSYLNKSTLTNQMQYYLDLICVVLKYMNEEKIISYLPSNLDEFSLSESLQFIVNDYYMHIEFKGEANYVVLYPFEYYSIFGNNNYPAKTRLELLNLYLCIKAYSKQAKEDHDVCCKSKRSLSNLTGISQRVIDNRYKMLVDLNLISSYIMNTENEKNILLTVASNTSSKYVTAEIDRYARWYGHQHKLQEIKYRPNVPFVDNRKNNDNEDFDVETTLSCLDFQDDNDDKTTKKNDTSKDCVVYSENTEENIMETIYNQCIFDDQIVGLKYND